MIVVYLADGRFSPPKDATRELLPGQIPVEVPGEATATVTSMDPEVDSTANAADPSVHPVAPDQPQPHHRATGAAQ
jgi:hypothetical protein